MTARVRAPTVYARSRELAVSLQLRLGGSLVAPDAGGTFTLRSPSGAVVSTGTAIVTSSVASYTVEADDLPTTLPFGTGYGEEWDLEVGGVAHLFSRPAVLARRPLYCPITEADLDALYPGIAAMLGDAAPSWQGSIDEAWADLLQHLASRGQWPEAIVDVDSLRKPTRELALYHVFRALTMGNSSDRWRTNMADHREEYRASLGSITFTADDDQDGIADSANRRSPGGVVGRSSAPRHEYASSGGGSLRGGSW